MLLTVAHVELAPLALPEVGKGTGPHSGLHDDDAVLFGAVSRVRHRVLHAIAIGAQDPSRVVTLARLVLRDGLQSELVGVGAEDAIDLLIAILHFLTEGVARLVVVQDALGVMHPAGLFGHLLGGGRRERLLGVLWRVRLHLERQFALLLALGDLVAASGHELSGVVDASDLCAQVELLLLEVEGVGHNYAIEVTREAHLDHASGGQVLRVQVGESDPGTLSLVCNIVGVLVDTDAASLTALRSSVFRQVLGLKSLNDVVVFSGARDLTPEAERASLGLSRELLERLLQNKRTVLAELDACLVEDVPVEAGQVLHESQDGASTSFAFFASICSGLG
mmetsp:Transcript_44693/g.59316  ORF Transcript_44693/g.59316 Transcript_44693/m.59316 type:complete len:336 (-) Transcript_44693:357-1364(-)